MPENNGFWDLYWEKRLQAMENLGKREAILAASRLIRHLFQQTGRPVSILELGCGEGQVVGTLVDSHAAICNNQTVVGVDYNPKSLAQCRRDFPGFHFLEGDFTDPSLLAGSGKVDLILFVNALHEVFSSVISPEFGEVDGPIAKQRVENALAGAIQLLKPNGWLLLFDGVEPDGDGRDSLTIRFMDYQARADFELFARQYRPFQITYRETSQAMIVQISRRDFTRYITKSIFLGKPLWQTEREESYQYFSVQEFRDVFARLDLEITELRTLTMNEEKWRRAVNIETPGEDFPQEHILILAQRKRGSP